MKRELDKIDLKILSELQEQARISIVELASRVNLTKTPCSERVKQLESQGYIHRYRAELDANVLGLNHIAFVQVVLSSTAERDLVRFNDAAREIPEIQSCHMIAGNFDYLLKVRTRDIDHYRSVLGGAISNLPGVQQTHTYVVMENVKDEMTLPVATINE